MACVLAAVPVVVPVSLPARLSVVFLYVGCSPDYLPHYFSLGLVLPTYSENHIKANLSDQILQVQCKYPGIPSILHSVPSLSLFPLFPPLSLYLSLVPKYDLMLRIVVCAGSPTSS